MAASKLGKASRFTTNDGVSVKYTESGKEDGLPIIFLHSWSANGSYWCKNVPELAAAGFKCFTLDYRSMGDSEQPGHGFRVSRLSTDLHCFVEHIKPTQKIVLCGSSLGFTVVSLYLEMFGQARVSGVCFVDQSCAMYHRPGWYTGAPDLSNPAMCADLMLSLRLKFAELVEGIIEGGFGEAGPTAEDREFMRKEIKKCDPVALGLLMQDHANLDVRDFMPQIKVPVLNCIGEKTKCHHIEGIAYIGRNVQYGMNLIFRKMGHFLYYEDPESFNKCIKHFVETCHTSEPSEVMTELRRGPCAQLEYK